MTRKILFSPLVALTALVFHTNLSSAQSTKVTPPPPSAAPQTVIITKKKNPAQKITIVIDSNDVTVNGKPARDFKSDDLDIIQPDALSRDYADLATAEVYRSKALAPLMKEKFRQNMQSNKAFLGVMSEKDDKGARITEVTENSAAEKAGLKEDDIITKIDTSTISSPDDLYRVVGKHAVGDKINITYTRDNATKSATATLDKNDNFRVFSWNTPEGGSAFSYGPGSDDFVINGAPFIQKDFNFSFDRKPRLGVQIQDTENEEGVKVEDVDDEGPAAKAGIEEEDIITSVNGKNIKGVDDVRDATKDVKAGDMIKITYKRKGAVKNVDVKFPKPLKSMDL